MLEHGSELFYIYKYMDEHLKIETEKLRQSWSKYDRAVLRNYLIKDVEDPRINVQSILTRHWLIKQLFGNTQIRVFHVNICEPKDLIHIIFSQSSLFLL